MILKELKIENFVIFPGVQELKFSTDPVKNVTVVFLTNTAGKTTLRNVFRWVLYEILPVEDGKSWVPEQLAADRTAKTLGNGASLTVAARLTFDRGDETFIVERRMEVTKDERGVLVAGVPSLTLSKIAEDGSLSEQSYPQKKINTMLPEALSGLFFVSGEYLERLGHVEHSEDVEKAIKTLLNIEEFERGAQHLRGKVKQYLKKEAGKYKTPGLHDLADQETKLEEQIEQAKAAQQQHRENHAALGEEIERIEEIERATESTRVDSAERDFVRKEIKRVKQELNEAKLKLAEAISADGFVAFISKPLETTDAHIDGARKKGDLPANVKPQFVDDLIARGECICGDSLNPDDNPRAEEARACLDRFKATTGLAALEEAISTVGNSIVRLRERRKDFERVVRDTTAVLDTKRTELSKLQDQERELSERIGETLAADRDELREKKLKASTQQGELNVRIANLAKDIANHEEGLKEIRETRRRNKESNAQADLIRRRMVAADAVASAYEQIASLKKDSARRSLTARMADLWQRAAYGTEVPSVDDSYRLRLNTASGRPARGLAGGQIVMLAFAFVASLIQKARQDAEASDDHSEGGHYPLVIDSPFSALGHDYRERISRWVPGLTNQLIIFLRDDQWYGPAETTLKDRIGHFAIGLFHNPKLQKSLNLYGEEHPFVVRTDEPDTWSELREVR